MIYTSKEKLRKIFNKASYNNINNFYETFALYAKEFAITSRIPREFSF